MRIVETIVIGAGPGGGTAAIYLARFNHPVLLLDAGQAIRGRTSWAYEMQNVPGFTGIVKGEDFLRDLHAQADSVGVERKQAVVKTVSLHDDGRFWVATDSESYIATYVIVAVGVRDVLPDIPGIEEYLGYSVFSCPACNWFQTKDRPTGIVACDDRGLTTALTFNALQKGSVRCVIPSSSSFQFDEKLVARVIREGIPVYRSPLIVLEGEPGDLSSVHLADGTTIELEILYTRLGIRRMDGFLRGSNLGLERDDEQGCIEVDFHTFETTIPNMFAVGPCNSGEDQVAVSAGQGAIAGMHIHERIITGLGI